MLKHLKKSAASTCLATLLFCVGCVTQQQVARDFQANRQRSFRALMSTRDDPNRVGGPELRKGPLSTKEAISLAMSHNKSLQAARLRLTEAEGRLLEAASTALPTVGLSAAALAHDDQAIVNPDETYQWQILARQPLYLGGVTSAAIDAAAVFAYMSQQEVRQATQAVQLSVRSHYLAALLAHNLEQVAQKAKLDAQENLRLVEVSHRQGAALKFEVLRAKVRLSAIEAQLIERQNQRLLAVASLLKEMGISQLSDIQLTDELTYEPLMFADNRFLFEAVTQRPELLTAESLVRLARDNVTAEQAGNRPKVYLQGTYQQDYPGYNASLGSGNHWERSMNAGVVVEWPIFNGLATAGLVTQAKAQLKQQQRLLEEQEQSVQLDVKQAWLTLESSRQFVQSQQGNVSNAEEALRLTQVDYREGTGTSLDVISAELSLATARSNYIRAVYDHQLALLRLHWSVGTIGEKPLAAESQESQPLVDEPSGPTTVD